MMSRYSIFFMILFYIGLTQSGDEGSVWAGDACPNTPFILLNCITTIYYTLENCSVSEQYGGLESGILARLMERIIYDKNYLVMFGDKD